jgi:hypothetical protein
MNIFEDLIDELKEDNLLEETVIKINSAGKKPFVSEESVKEENANPKINAEEDKIIVIDESQLLPDSDSVSEKETDSILDKDYEISDKDYEIILPEVSEDITVDKIEVETNQTVSKNEPSKEAEFFSQRAVNEISFLQMVEHVFAGVERDQMKVVPKPYDALKVKKILHTFLQVSKEKNTQETENWYSTLTHRDRRISINHLRHYCETARPMLSTPALVSLARFYRNSPYSEQVRGKFDFIVTRLFSKDSGDERRVMAFSGDELVTHLKELYAEWSSIPLYPNEDDSEILLLALNFEDFITEATIAESFDELIRNDFFNRLRLFKKDTNENFFSPLIVAADVESNIRIGNRYVELLEKEKSNKSVYEDKYGFLHDQCISDATGKTFQLVELLSRKTEKPKLVEPPRDIKKQTKTETQAVKEINKETKAPQERKTVKETPKTESNSIKKEENKSYFGVSSWLLTAVIFTVIASIGIYIWASNSSSEAKENAVVKTVNLENSSLKENIQTASIKSEIFTAIVLPSWNNLASEKKEELLKKIMSIGGDKGFQKVQLLNTEGKIVGFASPEKVEVYNP